MWPCGYVYDPEVGDPDGGIAPMEHHLKIFQMIGYVQSVDWVKMF